MTVRRASDNVTRTKAQVTSALTEVTEETRYTVDQDYLRDFHQEGMSDFESGRSLLWHEGQVITQSELDAAFPAATVTAITPATGAAAGGTAVTITGTNFSNAATVAIGGVAATSVVVVSPTEITCVTGAHAAGAVNVVVTDEGVAATLTNGYTYA
jgi:hypothetical protein